MSLSSEQDFSFKEGPAVFSPKDLVQLARPGSGAANPEGDLLIVSVSKYSFEDKKYALDPTDTEQRCSLN